MQTTLKSTDYMPSCCQKATLTSFFFYPLHFHESFSSLRLILIVNWQAKVAVHRDAYVEESENGSDFFDLFSENAIYFYYDACVSLCYLKTFSKTLKTDKIVLLSEVVLPCRACILVQLLVPRAPTVEQRCSAVLPNNTRVILSKMAAAAKVFRSRNLFFSGIFLSRFCFCRLFKFIDLSVRYCCLVAADIVKS